MTIEEQREHYRQRPEGMSWAEWYRRLSILGFTVSEIARLAGKGYQPVYNTLKSSGTDPSMERSRSALEAERRSSSEPLSPPDAPPAAGDGDSPDGMMAVLLAILEEVRAIRRLIDHPATAG